MKEDIKRCCQELSSMLERYDARVVMFTLISGVRGLVDCAEDRYMALQCVLKALGAKDD